MTDPITLKHFFSSLPRPFIELDQGLRAEIADRFSRTNRWTRDQQFGTLEKVLEKAKSTEEKEVLVKLCQVFRHYPAEGGRAFTKPLFRTEVSLLNKCTTYRISPSANAS